MRSVQRVGIAFLLTLIPSGRAVAQVCSGMAPFSLGPMRVAANGQLSAGSRTLGGHFALGAREVGPFGGITVGHTSFANPDGSQIMVAGHTGYSLAIGPSAKTEICPTAYIDMLSGPTFNAGFGAVKISGRTLGAGLSIGRVARSGGALDFVPFASATFFREYRKSLFNGSEQAGWANSGAISLGAGFNGKNGISFQPNVTIPVGVDGRQKSVGAALSFSFGRTQ